MRMNGTIFAVSTFVFSAGMFVGTDNAHGAQSLCSSDSPLLWFSSGNVGVAGDPVGLLGVNIRVCDANGPVASEAVIFRSSRGAKDHFMANSGRSAFGTIRVMTDPNGLATVWVSSDWPGDFEISVEERWISQPAVISGTFADVDSSLRSKYRSGDLIRLGNYSGIYRIDGDTKHLIPSAQAFASYGLRWEDVRQENDFRVWAAYRTKRLIRLSSDDRVYQLVGGDGLVPYDMPARHWIPTPEILEYYGFLWSDVREVSKEEFESYADTKFVTNWRSPDVYMIANGILKRKMPTSDVLLSYGTWGDVLHVSIREMETLEANNLIRLDGDYRVFALSSDLKRWVKTADAFHRIGYDWKKIAVVNAFEFSVYPTGTPIE